jgi:hypothetical protein
LLRFILYFVLFFVLYRLIRSIIQYVVKDRSTSEIKNPNPPQKSKYENIEEAKFTEIKEKDEKKSEK